MRFFVPVDDKEVEVWCNPSAEGYIIMREGLRNACAKKALFAA
jgi:hypothetical protein